MSSLDPIRERGWEGAWSGLAALLSTGTLICCALPIALVSLGFGAAVAGLVEQLPWLPILSRYKAWLFGAAGLMLAAGLALTYRPGRSCPADPERAAACERLDGINRALLWSGVTIWMVGFVAAYLALPVVRWLEG
jgi:hypothetical protein